MNKIHRLLLAAALGTMAFAPCASRADDVYTVIIKKQEQKEQTSWYLDDWFEVKNRIRLMDMWLALHTPSPTEFYFAPEYQIVSSSQGGATEPFSGNSWRIRGAAYYSIFGIGLEKGFNPDSDFSALLFLRIFGLHAQTTNLTFQTGIRSQGDPVDGRNAIVGVGYTLSITRDVGLDGYYRHFFTTAGSGSGTTSSGDRWELGPYLDLKPVRLYGKYFSDSETQTAQSVDTPVSGKGFVLGAQLFF